jgi:poly(hydroxyalkanoate) depolymerase family esterase
MKTLKIDMINATRLVREGKLHEAMAALRNTLPDALRSTVPARSEDNAGPAEPTWPVLDRLPSIATEARRIAMRFSQVPRNDRAGTTSQPHMPEAIRGLLDRIGQFGSPGGLDTLVPPAVGRAPVPVPDGARFEERIYANQAGSRAYKLYVPSGYSGQTLPLVVMLHGCTQSPDDFALGTRMNDLAEEQTFFVAYPAQAHSANASKCWNWFNAGDQQRDQGEPSLIAGITREIMRDFPVESGRVYIAGMSAGGAAAAIMGATYPDLYAAIGVHSGLACGAASDVQSAFVAMRQGGSRTADGSHRRGAATPTIVFHGDRDTTVSPVNGDQVIAQSTAAAGLRPNVSRGEAPGGRRYTRTVHADESGRPMLEQWVLHGVGHAWSGGSAAGSYTEAHGPDASREMIRFFLQQPIAATSS